MGERELLEEWMLVWGTREDFAKKRLVLLKSNNGSCICVAGGHEDEYFKEENIEFEKWSHCKPSPKKTRRLMNEAEFMELRKENPHMVYGRPELNDWWVNFSSADFCVLEQYQYSLDLQTWHDFYVEVEE